MHFLHVCFTRMVFSMVVRSECSSSRYAVVTGRCLLFKRLAGSSY